MPAVGLAEMMFPSPAAVPPMVTPGGAAHEHAEGAVAQGARAGVVGADAVAQDHDACRGGPGDRHARLRVGRDHVARALLPCRRWWLRKRRRPTRRSPSWPAAWFRSGPCRCSCPSTTVFVAPAPMSMPSPVFPEITLPARVVGPPIVVPVPPARRCRRSGCPPRPCPRRWCRSGCPRRRSLPWPSP